MFRSAVFVNPKPTYWGMPNISTSVVFHLLCFSREKGFEGEGDERSGTGVPAFREGQRRGRQHFTVQDENLNSFHNVSGTPLIPCLQHHKLDFHLGKDG